MILDPPQWTPSVEDVALRLIARTLMSNGALANTFNSQTVPTDQQVELIITQQVSLLAPKLGDVSDSLMDSARALLALKSAIVIEESFFLEQVNTNLSPHEEMCKEFAFSLKSYLEAAMGEVPNGYCTAALSVGTLYPAYELGTY